MHSHNNLHDAVLISPLENSIVKKLNELGIKTVNSVEIPDLITYERFHADMQLLKIGDIAFIPQNAYSLLEKVSPFINNVVVCEELKGKYPENVLLNAALIGNHLFCKVSALAKEVAMYCERNGTSLVDVKQGYAKCSTLVLGDNALITADITIYERCIEYGIDALLIRCGNIRLEGADYGFIGGCSGVIGDKVFFFGDVSKHPDSRSITDFITQKGYKIVCLSENELTDIGGFVVLS